MLYLAINQHRKQLTVNLRNEQGDVLVKRQVSTEWPRTKRRHRWAAERRYPAHCHESPRCAGGNHRRHRPPSLGDRAILSFFQAHAELPLLVEHRSCWHSDSGVLCAHRLSVDPPLDRWPPHTAQLRNGLSLSARVGGPGGTDGPPGILALRYRGLIGKPARQERCAAALLLR